MVFVVVVVVAVTGQVSKTLERNNTKLRPKQTNLRIGVGYTNNPVFGLKGEET